MKQRLLSSALISMAALSFGACGPSDTTNEDLCKARLPGDVVISEYLVNPSGTDTGQEFVELYNATGAELDLKGLTLYASDPSGGSEKAHTFRTQKIPAAGYLAVGDARTEPLPPYLGYSYGNDLGALRNTGGKIGVRCGTKVLDEVTYETTTDGHSTQLSGSIVPDSAVNDLAANWCDGAATYDGSNFGTPGAANASCGGTQSGGTCVDPVTQESRAIISPLPGQLVITELMPDPANVSDDAGEWFELHAPEGSVDLNGLTVLAGSGKSTLTSESCLTIRSGGYGVLARNGDSMANGGLENVLTTVTTTLSNSSGSLSINNGDTVIDQVSWDKSQSGVSIQLSPDALNATGNDDPQNWCAPEQTYGSGMDKGTPGAANDACPIVLPKGQCLDADTGTARDVVTPAVGDLVITEFMANPAASDDTKGEWFEVLATKDVDLNGLELANEGTGTSTVDGSDCVHLAAGSYALFARSSDSSLNGGLPQVTGTFSFGLSNSGSRAIVLRSDTTEIDRVTWTSSTSGVSTQLSSDLLDAVSNDDPANFCAAAAEATYGAGDLGTPGVANAACPK